MKKEERENAAEALGCGLMAVCGMMVIICIFALQYEAAKNMAKSLQNDTTTPYGYAIGKVKSVETWKAEPFVHKDGNMTITLNITDRCKVIFEDGRSKEMLGMPKEAIPIGKEVAIVWAKFDIFLEVGDAEEYRKKHLPGREK